MVFQHMELGTVVSSDKGWVALMGVATFDVGGHLAVWRNGAA
jgi:hypothetical protein